MYNKYYSEIAVPIKPPYGFQPTDNNETDFTFDREDRFTDYQIEKNNKSYEISLDDQGQWYFFKSFVCNSLDELKLSRQIFRPSYLKNEDLQLVDLMQDLDISPFYEGHDKAYGHVLSLVPELDSVPAFRQARLANYDGTDDPTIIKKIHYIQNEYKGECTRFISGFETRSFATITENEYYAKEIHQPYNARNYLKLFIYFSRYSILPSQQMMPRFLANLWASTQSMNTNANPALYKEEFIKEEISE
ncbi:hypothetical protein J7I93_00365 [Bacillus sp. ISL-47]|uniref:hypothetical protein n=1 Tax=Bacillus sp. ISL-47 TaxID=2819130 RepID=UPI001BE5C195|nr:hypothetical protein [Bacillus sp. ISL-47]MBT2686629.1 hypothetical protein [Bacillus sp. ISL-47]MBT2707021.1 hypothetical protein [Pseudomonas sp. ISL-84]